MKLKSILLFLNYTFIMISHNNAQVSQGVKEFSLKNLVKETGDSVLYNRFLDEPTISAGVYQLKAGAKDDQSPHVFDEIYYILEGEAKLKTADTSAQVKPGSIIYVKAHVPHHFFNITKNLLVSVLFSKAEPSATDPSFKFYKQHEVEATAAANEVTWSAFHQCQTLTLGIYTLPKITGGDSPLTHAWDEVNVVVKGQAKFSINDKEISLEKGDIVFVPKGNKHHFHDLKNDFEVMILFEKKSTQK